MNSHPQKIQLDHPEPMRYPCRPMGLKTSSYMSLYSNFPESISTGSVPHHHYIKKSNHPYVFPGKSIYTSKVQSILDFLNGSQVSLFNYLKKSFYKTASLLAAACRASAVLTGLRCEVCDTWT